ncbi:hypothetical protein [Motiliproteus sediminis]|uniref:hypothetical protein n=1 Tax=Motiliproteus sediminis TaxID=1468178 RepID=UPI001AEF57EE|nr:hypothetical protein [Motiliproteus sediminis]
MTDGLTIPEAIRRIFGVDVATESPLLKNKAMSLERNGLIKSSRTKAVERSSIMIGVDQLTPLHNALVLNAVFSDPKQVKKIFTDRTYRTECAQILKKLFGERDSLLGIALRTDAAFALSEALDSNWDLNDKRLPNPFEQLPQVALGKDLSVLQALLAQASTLAPADSVLLAYLKGDLKRAAELVDACGFPPESEVGLLGHHIKAKLKEAADFDDLLDMLRKS